MPNSEKPWHAVGQYRGENMLTDQNDTYNHAVKFLKTELLPPPKRSMFSSALVSSYNARTTQPIFIEFCGIYGSRMNRLHFGGNPDLDFRRNFTKEFYHSYWQR